MPGKTETPSSAGGHGPLEIADATVAPGTRTRLDLAVARLATQTPLTLPVAVLHGHAPGPTLWLSAAIHGDELNGLGIIHRVLGLLDPRTLSGTLLAVPVVNVFGFIHQSRYLPDRRDLNRHFPGSARGSLASRLAHLFMREIVSRSSHGLDLHTGSNERTNLPQVRGDLEDEETLRCAEAFGAPIMIHGEAPGGSLRRAAVKRGVATLVFEAGDPQRLNEETIDMGVRGVLRVMTELGMIERERRRRPCLRARRRTWVRAPRSGILRLNVGLGDRVEKRQEIGAIHDIFGDVASTVKSPAEGLVIGHTNNPVVHQGDGLIHLAREVAGPE